MTGYSVQNRRQSAVSDISFNWYGGSAFVNFNDRRIPDSIPSAGVTAWIKAVKVEIQRFKGWDGKVDHWALFARWSRPYGQGAGPAVSEAAFRRHFDEMLWQLEGENQQWVPRHSRAGNDNLGARDGGDGDSWWAPTKEKSNDENASASACSDGENVDHWWKRRSKWKPVARAEPSDQTEPSSSSPNLSPSKESPPKHDEEGRTTSRAEATRSPDQAQDAASAAEALSGGSWAPSLRAHHTSVKQARAADFVQGRRCEVTKHSNMGCSIVAFRVKTVPELIAAKHSTITIGGVSVDLKLQNDPKRGIDPYGLFLAWGAQVEKATPLPAKTIAEEMDKLFDLMQKEQETPAAEALAKFIGSRGGRIATAQVQDFWRKHPEHQSAMKGRLFDFCETHQTLLQFRHNFITCRRQPTASSSGSKVAPIASTTSATPLLPQRKLDGCGRAKTADQEAIPAALAPENEKKAKEATSGDAKADKKKKSKDEGAMRTATWQPVKAKGQDSQAENVAPKREEVEERACKGWHCSVTKTTTTGTAEVIFCDRAFMKSLSSKSLAMKAGGVKMWVNLEEVADSSGAANAYPQALLATWAASLEGCAPLSVRALADRLDYVYEAKSFDMERLAAKALVMFVASAAPKGEPGPMRVPCSKVEDFFRQRSDSTIGSPSRADIVQLCVRYPQWLQVWTPNGKSSVRAKVERQSVELTPHAQELCALLPPVPQRGMLGHDSEESSGSCSESLVSFSDDDEVEEEEKGAAEQVATAAASAGSEAETESTSVPSDAATAVDERSKLSASSSVGLVPVAALKWCQKAIKISFADGRLLVQVVQELLDGKLHVDDLLPLDVAEKDNGLYAVSGNQRLWVLREYERLARVPVLAKVKRASSEWSSMEWVQQAWTTEVDGISVQFEAPTLEDREPDLCETMLEALAAADAAQTLLDDEEQRALRDYRRICERWQETEAERAQVAQWHVNRDLAGGSGLPTHVHRLSSGDAEADLQELCTLLPLWLQDVVACAGPRLWRLVLELGAAPEVYILCQPGAPEIFDTETEQVVKDQDLVELLKILDVTILDEPQLLGIRVLRATLLSWPTMKGSAVAGVVIECLHCIPGVSRVIEDLTTAAETAAPLVITGGGCSGKRTFLRDVGVEMSSSRNVVVLDADAELRGTSAPGHSKASLGSCECIAIHRRQLGAKLVADVAARRKADVIVVHALPLSQLAATLAAARAAGAVLVCSLSCEDSDSVSIETVVQTCGRDGIGAIVEMSNSCFGAYRVACFQSTAASHGGSEELEHCIRRRYCLDGTWSEVTPRGNRAVCAVKGLDVSWLTNRVVPKLHFSSEAVVLEIEGRRYTGALHPKEGVIKWEHGPEWQRSVQ
mmetsp:Transcript_18943/g.44084  ORF Transcript_18943/g.44084 Transcript_18943/m.44084 type:complete len:1366 (+) Transcript_18943:68-4165(+)